jgi:hypothetical protein
MKYILFKYDDYYPSGGFLDEHHFCESIEICKEIIAQEEMDYARAHILWIWLLLKSYL